VLIADRGNNRLLVVDPQGRTTWQFPQPGDLAPGETFRVPDDAFFTPDGARIIATQEDDFVITVIDVASHRIVWRYGVAGVPGAAPNHLWNPDDALLLPSGDVFTADIKNCRLLLIRFGSHAPERVYGRTTPTCRHQPPTRWGSPNGAFPMANGHFLVTEINGDWVDELDLSGRLYGSFHPPVVAYPSDSNEVSPGVYLTVDYSQPGLIETFDGTGQLLWRFKPSGPDALDKPSLALPLPNGDVLANDDYNHRVIVVDPRTNQVVWQYGRTGTAGSQPGLLDIPDGVDLAPPYSLLVAHAPTIGRA
jgi:DNA-binding beta-propeller fold protein YncE